MRQCLLVVAISLASAPAPAAERKYTVVLSGHTAGTETVSESGSERLVHFEYSDRGRGPKLVSRLVLAPDGTLASVTTTGHDYLKTPVDERFAVEGGEARWKNKAEQGERPAGGPALYTSIDGTAEELGILVQALAKNGGELALLPEGRSSLERRGGRVCTAGGKTAEL